MAEPMPQITTIRTAASSIVGLGADGRAYLWGHMKYWIQLPREFITMEEWVKEQELERVQPEGCA